MIEKRRVHRFTDHVVPAERERDVADAAADLGAGQILLNPAGGFDEIHRIVIVLFDAGCDGQNIGIEDDIGRRQAHPFRQNLVGARTDLLLSLQRIGLSLLIERHDDDGGSVPMDQRRLIDKLLLRLL